LGESDGKTVGKQQSSRVLLRLYDEIGASVDKYLAASTSQPQGFES
jgi:hypothetical protein